MDLRPPCWLWAAVNSATSNCASRPGFTEVRFGSRCTALVPGLWALLLEINSATVEWFGNGTSAFVVANNSPNEWKEYRVVVRGHVFKVWQNGMPSGLDLAVPHADARGKLSLHLSVGEPSDVALRRIRIKE